MATVAKWLWGVILTVLATIIADGVLLWLEKFYQVVPKRWVAEMIGSATNASDLTSAHYLILGVAGIIGLVIWLIVERFFLRKKKNDTHYASQNPGVTYKITYVDNCTIVHLNYSDVEKPKLGENVETFIESSGITILNAGNVASLDDDGFGEFTVNFDKELLNDYFVKVYTDKSLAWEVVKRTQAFCSIKFEGEEPSRFRIEFKESPIS